MRGSGDVKLRCPRVSTTPCRCNALRPRPPERRWLRQRAVGQNRYLCTVKKALRKRTVFSTPGCSEKRWSTWCTICVMVLMLLSAGSIL